MLKCNAGAGQNCCAISQSCSYPQTPRCQYQHLPNTIVNDNGDHTKEYCCSLEVLLKCKKKRNNMQVCSRERKTVCNFELESWCFHEECLAQLERQLTSCTKCHRTHGLCDPLCPLVTFWKNSVKPPTLNILFSKIWIHFPFKSILNSVFTKRVS